MPIETPKTPLILPTGVARERAQQKAKEAATKVPAITRPVVSADVLERVEMLILARATADDAPKHCFVFPADGVPNEYQQAMEHLVIEGHVILIDFAAHGNRMMKLFRATGEGLQRLAVLRLKHNA